MKLLLTVGALIAPASGFNLADGGSPPYLDASIPLDDRVNDLLSRMTLPQKVGQMYHARYLPNRPDDIWPQLTDQFLTHFVYTGGVTDLDEFIDWFNEVQEVVINETPLGIPVTISTDPQHGWTQDGVASNTGTVFSKWPEPMGIAAMRSSDRMIEYGDVVRQELAVVGIRQVLYPQVDLATEPRWGRMSLTLGEDADLTTTMMLDMLRGLQGGSQVTKDSLVATVKHFPGGGPQEVRLRNQAARLI